MACECASLVDEKLSARNTRLELAIIFGESKNPGVMIRTEQIEKGRGKAKATTMFPTFCPFCGVKYDGETV